jgi:orotate phosphoribosyltransferase
MTKDGAGFVGKRARSELQAKIGKLCIETGGPFTLSTGEVSNFYFDCKRAVLQGDVLCMIAAELLREANELPEMPDAVGGLSIGADFLVAATIQLAAQRGHPMIYGCVVRKERKDHGTRNYIENAQPDGTKIMVVDDVITTGTSTGLACDRLLDAGNRIVGIVGLIDREQDGVETLAKKYGVHVKCLFKSSDFPSLTQANERNCEPMAATA